MLDIYTQYWFDFGILLFFIWFNLTFYCKSFYALIIYFQFNFAWAKKINIVFDKMSQTLGFEKLGRRKKWENGRSSKTKWGGAN